MTVKPSIDSNSVEKRDSSDTVVACSSSAWQFRLSTLFWFVTGWAFALGIGLAIFPSAVVVPAGIVLAWLNARGRLAQFQTPAARRRAYLTGWSLLGISLALPSVIVPGCGTQPQPPLLGWEVAVWGPTTIYNAMAENPGSTDAQEILGDLYCLFLIIGTTLGNLCVLCSVWRWRRLDCEQPSWLSIAVSLSAAMAWSVALVFGAMLTWGYFVWSAGYASLFVSHRISYRVFVAMLALQLIVLLLLLLENL